MTLTTSVIIMTFIDMHRKRDREKVFEINENYRGK
jgi:hypothetical protein